MTERRVVSVDAYRGVVMLLLVSGGGLALTRFRGTGLEWIAHQLEHSEWEGCTLWDLVQPAFMFTVGVAMPLARTRGWREAAGRAWRLLALGVLLDVWQTQRLAIGLVSVLQQIALAYFVAFAVLRRPPRAQLIAAAGLLAAHTALFILYGKFGGSAAWEMDDNVGRALDRLLHLPVDADGYVTVAFVSSAATVIAGVLAGELVASARPPRAIVLRLAVWGAVGIAAGLSLAHAVPMVKHIWTASFGLYATGWSCVGLAAAYGVVEVLGARRLALPFVVVGMNSLLIYVLSGVLNGPLRALLRPVVGAALAALLLLAGKWLLAAWLYRKRLFFRV